MAIFLTALTISLLPASLYFIWYLCLILDGVNEERDTEERINHRG
jgi:hypothetical protein